MLPALTKARTSLAAASEIWFFFVNRNLTKPNPVVFNNCTFRGFVAPGTQNCLTKRKTIQQTSEKKGFTSKTHPTYSSELELDSLQFERISDDTLESLTEHFDQLVEQAAHLQDADVSYGDGVLTIHFGDPHGSYVINRQSPNKQIWLSSPKSGPKRYDFSNGKWIYKHDGKSLHDLLNDEIPAIIRNQASFDGCSYSGKEQYSDSSSPRSLPD